jgi:YHS domain-containing protein
MVLFSKDTIDAVMALDPVCGMTVDPNKTPFMSAYQGTRVYFCCAGCKEAFERNPAVHTLPPETG